MDTNDNNDVNSVDEIYRKLVKGVGHEFVNDENVAELIQRAEADGRSHLAAELREWQAPC
jgi:hypothetical protein